MINDWQWKDYAETGSTNDEALNWSLGANSRDKIIITAKLQTKGRGRFDRKWIGMDGNLFMSLALPFDIKDNAALVFISSLAVLQTIKQINSDADVVLKWPNDVLINNKKVSGILIERGHNGYMVVGIGVNIKASPSSLDLIYPATNLAEIGLLADRIEFMKLYIYSLDSLHEIWQERGFAKIVELWQAYAKGLNEAIEVHTSKGIKKGIFTGIDIEGRLLLRTETKIEAIFAGDVFFKDK